MSPIFEPPDVLECLEATDLIDSTHPGIAACALRLCVAQLSPKERACQLFRFVRDEIAYEFLPRLEREEYRASRVLEAGKGFCVQKAILLCALGRAAGIPTALVLSDLRDATLPEALVRALGTDTLYHHGLNALYLDGRWMLADASLPQALCERRGYRPAHFDGAADAMLAPTTLAGSPHAIYEKIHGAYSEFPFEQMVQAFREGYAKADPAALEHLGYHVQLEWSR